MHKPLILLLIVATTATPIPIPSDPTEESPSEDTTITPSGSEYAPPSLIVIDDAEPGSDNGLEDSEDKSNMAKRHPVRTTPSPEELEERRQALIKALGGGGGDDDDGGGGGQLAASIMGFGSLATDVVSLLGSNANETFGPLREAVKRGRESFPDLGTQLNRFLRNGRAYASRAYKSLLKNARVKLTNTLRFLLAAFTRLSSTIGGLYRVVVSLLDVATRGIGTGVRVGSRLLASGSNATVNAVARGTTVLKQLSESGLLAKPFNQAVSVGQELTKGLTEDIFDKFEWTQEGLTSKIELVQALAPNYLLRAHESTTTEISTPAAGGDDPVGGYSKLTANEDEMVLLSLASQAAELMQRGGRDAKLLEMLTSVGTSTTPTTSKEEGPPQGLLNDIFGLQEEIGELKKGDKPKT